MLWSSSSLLTTVVQVHTVATLTLADGSVLIAARHPVDTDELHTCFTRDFTSPAAVDIFWDASTLPRRLKGKFLRLLCRKRHRY